MTILNDAEPSSTTPNQPTESMAAELLMLGKSMRALVGLKLAAVGLHSGQDELLLALYGSGQRAVSVLAETLGVRPSTVSKMLDRLMERGLVAREGDTTDARRTLVLLTPDGAMMVDRIREIHASLDADLAHDRVAGGPIPTIEEIRCLRAALVARLRRLR